MEGMACRGVLQPKRCLTDSVDGRGGPIRRIGASLRLTTLDTALKLVCLTILLFVTLKRTLRPGRVTVFRVIGAIAGYLLIGFTWTFVYQLLVQQVPNAIYFEPGTADAVAEQPSHFDLLQLYHPHHCWLR
jgi:hypothetical protein